MNNEIRNELLLIKSIIVGKEENKEIYTEQLLDRFEYDIKDQLKDLKYKQQELENNLELLEYVREEIKKGKK